jgi:hypothetical protein
MCHPIPAITLGISTTHDSADKAYGVFFVRRISSVYALARFCSVDRQLPQ